MTLFFDERQELREQILRYKAAETMTDKERANFLGLPQYCRIREGAKIIQQENLSIGEYCWIGEGAILDASGGLKIGQHTSIGSHVMIWTHSSHMLNRSGKNTVENNSLIERQSTRIGSRCFLGGPCVIMPGVTIGDKCIITPMSVVDKDLPEGTVYSHSRQQDRRVAQLEKRIQKLEDLLKSQRTQ